MNLDDQQFETRLRAFRPRAPQPLTAFAPRRSKRVLTTAVPVLALLLLLAGVLLLRSPKPMITPPLIRNAEAAPKSLAQWNALERAHQFDDALTLSARQSLPRTDAPNSALHILAKD